MMKLIFISLLISSSMFAMDDGDNNSEQEKIEKEYNECIEKSFELIKSDYDNAGNSSARNKTIYKAAKYKGSCDKCLATYVLKSLKLLLKK